jgi:tRNA (guanine37-N1)-methyltransferase
MLIQIITLLPEAILPYLNASMLHKAQDKKIVQFEVIDLRQFGLGPRKTVDDTPYGGGDGMVLMVEPLMNAVKFAKKRDKKAKVLLMTPRGDLWKQSTAQQYMAAGRGLIIICGRYEGYDERITEVVDAQICVGNYVLTGGEIPALTVVDSIVRLLPGVLGGETSAEIESFVSDDVTKEAPHYTRPAEFNGLKVPKELLSGNHAQIAKWRAKNGL